MTTLSLPLSPSVLESLPGMDQLGPHATIEEVVTAVLASAVAELMTRESELGTSRDPEVVHKARVATRRLRAHLRTLRPVLDRTWVDEVNAELKWLATALGEVRDADVLFEELDRQVEALPVVDVVPARELLAALVIEREAAQRRLAEVVDSERYQALLVRLLTAATDPPMRAGQSRGAGSARSVLPSLVARRWQGLRQGVAGLEHDSSNAALHEVRKRAKKLRYAAEMAQPVIGKPAARLAGAAEDLQAVLGEVHDAAVAETWLRHQVLAGSGGFPAAVVAGELIERERDRYWAHRNRWPQVWKKARAKRFRAWLRPGR